MLFEINKLLNICSLLSLAEDGQHIYLHNVNVRMLLKEFGSLEAAPQTITAKIVEVERVTMTEVDIVLSNTNFLQNI